MKGKELIPLVAYSIPSLANNVAFSGNGDGDFCAVVISTEQEMWRFKTRGGVFSFSVITGEKVF